MAVTMSASLACSFDCPSVRHIHPHPGKIAPRKARLGDGHHEVADISAGEKREMVRRQLKKHHGFRYPHDELRAPASRLAPDLQRRLLRVESPLCFKVGPRGRMQRRWI